MQTLIHDVKILKRIIDCQKNGKWGDEIRKDVSDDKVGIQVGPTNSMKHDFGNWQLFKKLRRERTYSCLEIHYGNHEEV